MIGTILLIVCKIFRHWLMTGPKPKTSRILLHLKSTDPRLLAKKAFWWIASVANHKRNRQRKLNPFPCQFLTLVLHQQNNKISSLVLLGIPITIVIHASLNFHPCCLEMARKKLNFLPSISLFLSFFKKISIHTSPSIMEQMEYRYLGNSGLKVSVLTLGSWITFGKRSYEKREICHVV